MTRLTLLLCLVLAPTLVHAATYHTAQSGGSDNNSCSAAQNAGSVKATVGAGIACLSGGDTLIVHAGIYPEQISNTIPSGSQGAPTVVKGNGNPAQGTGERAILKPPPLGGYTSVVKLKGSYVVIDGLVLDGINNKNVVIGLEGPNNTLQNSEIMNMGPIPHDGNGAACVDFFGNSSTVRGNKVHDCQNSGDDPNGLSTHCLYIHSSNNVIDGNDIFNCGSHGIQQYNGTGGSNNNVIRNNRVHESGARGILLSSGNNNVAYNNIVYGNGFTKPGGGKGALGCTDGMNNQFYNNTVYGNGTVAFRVGPYGANGTVFRSNISYSNQGDFQTDGSSGTVDDHNLLSTDPKFVNANGRDFHLQSGSPAINAGVAVSVVTTDYDGTTRANPPEIGAYEYGSTPPVEPPQSQERDPLVWIPFNEGAGRSAADNSGNHHPATLQNGVSWTDGKWGPFAITCDGDGGAVQIPGLLGGPATVTVSFWADVPDIPNPSLGSELFSMGDYLAVHLSATLVHPFYYSGDNAWKVTDAAVALVGTGWHHYVYVVDPAKKFQGLYIDSVLVSSSPYGNPIVWSGIGTDTYLCRHGNAAKKFLHGSLDELKISQHAWTHLEICAEYLGVSRLLPQNQTRRVLQDDARDNKRDER